MSKLNLSKTDKVYYTSKSEPEVVEFDPINYLSIKGIGDPSGQDFSDRIQALYPLAYTIKFAYKAIEQDFVVPKLEALWHFDNEKYADISMAMAPKQIPRSEWKYQLLIRMPDFVLKSQFHDAIKTLKAKKEVNHIDEIEFITLNEGKCVQMLHTGPFETEPVSLAKIKIFMDDQGLSKNGHHHEIYLSDFRKVAPEKLRTILREPFK